MERSKFLKKIIEVINELTTLKLVMSVIPETKRKGQGSESLGKYNYYYGGVAKEIRAQQEVSLMIYW